MPTEVIMPKVDMDMAAGTLAAWHAGEGAEVRKGAPLFDIETDKAAMEVESPATGRLHHVLAQPGQSVAVGAPVAWIYAEGEAVGARPGAGTLTGEVAPPPGTAQAAPAFDPALEARAATQPAYGSSDAVANRPAPAPAPAPGQPVQDLRATPAARRLARESGVVLDGVGGTGPRGRVQAADVLAAVAARAAAPARARDFAAETPPLRARGPEAPPLAWEPEEGELFVSTRPGTGTPLLLVHGFAADSAGWMPLERALPRDLPLVRIDLPSHGRSPRRRLRDFPDLARALVCAFDAAVDGPVHVLGHSLGGALALALADTRPRQVASLALIAPAGLGPEIDGATLTGIARASRAESLGPWLRRLAATPDGIGWDVVRAAMLARADPALRAAQLDLADALFPDGVQGFDLLAALGRVAAPLTLVWGRGDRVIPWRQALQAPGEAALHLLDGAGHVPHLECPARVAAILARHLRGAAGG